MADRKLKHWGWGYADDGLTGDQTAGLLKTFSDSFDIRPTTEGKHPDIADITLAEPRLTVRRGEVDRRHHRTGRRIGSLAAVDHASRQAQRAVLPPGPARRPVTGPSAARH